eukprot:1158990-Pelagomonas_calceolata.AAC.11
MDTCRTTHMQHINGRLQDQCPREPSRHIDGHLHRSCGYMTVGIGTLREAVCTRLAFAIASAAAKSFVSPAGTHIYGRKQTYIRCVCKNIGQSNLSGASKAPAGGM